MRNIVICFDILRDYGLQPAMTNSLKLYSMLVRDESQVAAYIPIPGGTRNGTWEALGKLAQSAVKLDPVGSGLAGIALFSTSPEVEIVKRYAFGNGLAVQLQIALDFLRENYADGDRLFVFGCSQAAAVALLFTQFLQSFGTLSPEIKRNAPEFIKIFFRSTLKDQPSTGLFKASFSRDCNVTFLGLWECVSNLSWVYSPVRLTTKGTFQPLCTVRHAVAIDERRAFFRPLLFHLSAQTSDRAKTKEMWFPGAHADVCGSYPEQESGLSQVALQWMVQEAIASGLKTDPSKQERLLGYAQRKAEWPPSVKPNRLGPAHQSLHGNWWLWEILPMRLQYPLTGSRKFKIPLGSRRYIPSDAILHQSAIMRMEAQPDYRPPNLPAQYQIGPP